MNKQWSINYVDRASYLLGNVDFGLFPRVNGRLFLRQTVEVIPAGQGVDFPR